MSNESASAANCPPQYIYQTGGENSVTMCQYSGAVTVMGQDGQPWMKVWWGGSDGTATQNINPNAFVNDSTRKFENDFQVWDEARKEAERRRAMEQY